MSKLNSLETYSKLNYCEPFEVLFTIDFHTFSFHVLFCLLKYLLTKILSIFMEFINKFLINLK